MTVKNKKKESVKETETLQLKEMKIKKKLVLTANHVSNKDITNNPDSFLRYFISKGNTKTVLREIKICCIWKMCFVKFGNFFGKNDAILSVLIIFCLES